MRKIYKIGLTLLFSFGCSLTLLAQQKLFTNARSNAILDGSRKRDVTPQKYSLTDLDPSALKSLLWTLPSEQNVMNRGMAPVMELPMPEGGTARFRVWESSVMAPGLKAKFPEIRTFAGQGIDDPYATVRFDFNPYFGFSAQILSPRGAIYIDPYSRFDPGHVISYYGRDNGRIDAFRCLVPNPTTAQRGGDANREDAGPCRGTELVTYRLALACTGEYAIAVCSPSAATKPLTLSKMVTSANRVSGVYEQELAVRLELIADEESIIYLVGGTDPYSNLNGPAMLGENQANLNATIGAGNYDIGHVFSTGGGGIAGLGVVCNTNNKGRGVTGLPNPVGDNFDIDFVAHEMGHQFGANHTFNSETGNCDGNRVQGRAYEVGSGTTIMGYAGICGTDNIQPHSDPFFHAVSFDEISIFLSGNGAGCGVLTPTNNNLPVITTMDNNNVSIPLGTPFILTGAATDADGDALTYNWEEWDLSGTANGQAWNSGANSLTAPLFKSRPSKTTGSRSFPDITHILNGFPTNPSASMGGNKGETMPLLARTMKFRLTVRDNRAGGGGVVSGGSGCQSGLTGIFSITTVAASQPFVVTSPNGGESYSAGSAQTITWNVVGTNAAPYNVANVRITMSIDGGLTYPLVVSTSTPNDGTEVLGIPVVIPTTTARIRIEALNNVFYDISNANFTITTAVSGFDFGTPADVTVACAGPTSAATTLTTSSLAGFNTPINLVASNVPAGASIAFGTNPVTPGNSTLVTLNGVNTLKNGTYAITVTGTAGAFIRARVINFIVSAGTGPAIGTQPTPVITCVGTPANFSVVSATALSYQWQVSAAGTGPFTDISGATLSTFSIPAVTAGQSGNQYRVQVAGQCNTTISTAVALTVQNAPAVTTNPQSQSLCEGSNATFLSAATGAGLTYQWQISEDGGSFGNIAGALLSSYTQNSITPSMNGSQYRVVVSGTCAPAATSAAATLTVASPVTISADPEVFVICETGNASFSATAAGSNILYQWQVDTEGNGTYTNIAGETAATLNLSSVSSSMDGNLYRLSVSNAICTTPDVSAGALLTVNARPTVTLAVAPTATLLPGQTSTITASIIPSSTGFDITWYRDGTVVPGVTGTSYDVNVSRLGAYKVGIVNQATGCNNESAELVISAATSSRLFIFPSPNNGQFAVSYYNSNGATTRQSIAVFDSKGARVYNSILPVSGPYTIHSIDLRGQARGVYYVVVGDANGKKIIDGKVVIH